MLGFLMGRSVFCSHAPGTDDTGLLQAGLTPQPCQGLQSRHCSVSCVERLFSLSLPLYFFQHFLWFFLLFSRPFTVKTCGHRHIPLSQKHLFKQKRGQSSVKGTRIRCPRHRFKLSPCMMLVSPCASWCCDHQAGLVPHKDRSPQSGHARIGFSMNV